MLELPKRISTVKYKDGIFVIDNTKEIPLEAFTPEIMAQFGACSSLVGFYIEGYPMTDELLEPLRGLKKMVNLGVVGGQLTDRSFEVLATMPQLEYLWLAGNAGMTGSGLDALRESKVNALGMNGTSLNDAGVRMAAQLPKLSYLHVDDTKVTFEGILTVAGNKRIKICSKTLLSSEQMDEFSAAQRAAGKKKLTLDKQAVAEATDALLGFFAAMTDWEIDAYKRGLPFDEVRQPLRDIFAEYVSEKPRAGYRPLGLSAEASGTYSGHEIIDAEQVTKNKLYLYTRDNAGSKSSFRFLMRNVDGVWKIDHAQVHWDGWQRWGL
ncbi:RhsIA family immunity protein [Ruminococcaceae bacterium OttesenSCG-928-L11]|nr:RhsIA family immunity protein [Ruminococcaceae bacterium OttesenSCG-928-L11]